MSEDDFYDSLDEDSSEYFDVSSSEADFTTILPLYSGEIAKTEFAQIPKKKVKKQTNTHKICPKEKKSYLTMYYEKKKKLKGIEGNGSVTTRAICGELSPKRDDEIEDDLKSVGEQSDYGSNSEDDEFYKEVIENGKNAPSANGDGNHKSNFKSRSSSNLKVERPFYFKSLDTQRDEKMELLKKRQNYGIKMSMKNRIRVEELRALGKIKKSKLCT